MAGITIALSKSENGGFTPVSLRLLVQGHPSREANARTKGFRVHNIAERLGQEVVNEILRRYGAGESATALAKDHDVAPSALLRLLRENNVVVRRKTISSDIKRLLSTEYEAGATIAELEAKHALSHGSVLRALHSAGVSMRAKAPRPQKLRSNPNLLNPPPTSAHE